jgi:hypothetical protein
MDDEKKLPPLTDFEIREAFRLQSATIRAVTEVLRAKGFLSAREMVKIKELRDALAAEVRRREEAGPKIVPPGRDH